MHLKIFLLTSFIYAALEIYAISIKSHYQYDMVICFALLYLGYRYRSAIPLDSLHYGYLAFFLTTHAIGVFDLYTHFIFGIEYDYWVHILFGITASLALMHALRIHTTMPYLQRCVATLIGVMGFAAFHELYEFFGALLLGEGDGVLFIGAGDLDQWDTHKDIFNNLIGAIVGVIGHGIRAPKSLKKIPVN